jgi:hypothetical protein
MTIQPGATRRQFSRITGTRRLLLLSCSQRKLDTPGKIPALRRYDGPAFQVVRRYLRETGDSELQVHVISAEYGVIAANHRIANYDRKMDAGRAAELRERSLARLHGVLRARSYGEVFVCTSRTYLGALAGIEDLHDHVKFAALGQGKKLASLRKWLRGRTQ